MTTRIVHPARTDRELRARLLADPRAAATAIGEPIPDDLAVEVLEERADRLYVVLPADGAELSDDDLDRVTGGGMSGSIVGGCWKPPGKGARYELEWQAGGAYATFHGPGGDLYFVRPSDTEAVTFPGDRPPSGWA